jgi:hypothetical protein
MVSGLGGYFADEGEGISTAGGGFAEGGEVISVNDEAVATLGIGLGG